LRINKGLILKLSYAVNSPNFLMPVYVDMILNQEEELPSSWYIYHKLTIPEYNNLLNKENDQQTWNYLLNLAGNSILDKADIPILPIIKRKDLLNNIIASFQNKAISCTGVKSVSLPAEKRTERKLLLPERVVARQGWFIKILDHLNKLTLQMNVTSKKFCSEYVTVKEIQGIA